MTQRKLASAPFPHHDPFSSDEPLQSDSFKGNFYKLLVKNSFSQGSEFKYFLTLLSKGYKACSTVCVQNNLVLIVIPSHLKKLRIIQGQTWEVKSVNLKYCQIHDVTHTMRSKSLHPQSRTLFHCFSDNFKILTTHLLECAQSIMNTEEKMLVIYLPQL